MFALMPWTRRNTLLPIEGPLARIPEEFGSLFDRLLNLPAMDTEWPAGWNLTTEETDKEFIVRFELPGFEPNEVKVESIADRLSVEAEHKEPATEAGKGERVERRVRRMLTLPSGLMTESAAATYRNGLLEVRFPRAPEAAGRKIEVKT